MGKKVRGVLLYMSWKELVSFVRQMDDSGCYDLVHLDIQHNKVWAWEEGNLIEFDCVNCTDSERARMRVCGMLYQLKYDVGYIPTEISQYIRTRMRGQPQEIV